MTSLIILFSLLTVSVTANGNGQLIAQCGDTTIATEQGTISAIGRSTTDDTGVQAATEFLGKWNISYDNKFTNFVSGYINKKGGILPCVEDANKAVDEDEKGGIVPCVNPDLIQLTKDALTLDLKKPTIAKVEFPGYNSAPLVVDEYESAPAQATSFREVKLTLLSHELTHVYDTDYENVKATQNNDKTTVQASVIAGDMSLPCDNIARIEPIAVSNLCKQEVSNLVMHIRERDFEAWNRAFDDDVNGQFPWQVSIQYLIDESDNDVDNIVEPDVDNEILNLKFDGVKMVRITSPNGGHRSAPAGCFTVELSVDHMEIVV
eukprot:m.13760 g.13760  ORF g.13760 m.13760 type:complete len:320 (-) comp4918_c0_seq1:76-1035(-)